MIEGSEFFGIVSERVFRVCHGVRWWSFLTEQTVRDKLRYVCQHMAAVFGSEKIIYLPDGFLRPEGALGLIYEGKGVTEMIDWLLENCGRPIQNIESIYRGEIESWNEDDYFIERLQQLPLSTNDAPNKRLQRTRHERASLLSNLGEPLKRISVGFLRTS